QKRIVFPGHQRLSPGNVDLHGRVVPSAYLQVRRQEEVNPQLLQPFFRGHNLGVEQYAGLVRIANDVLFQMVAPLGIGADHAIAQRLRLNPRDVTAQVAPFLVKESLAVGDEELRVPNLRAVNGGIVDLCHNTLSQSEPDAAGGRVSGTDSVLRTGGPRRWDSRMAKRIAVGVERIVRHGLGSGGADIHDKGSRCVMQAWPKTSNTEEQSKRRFT